MELILDGIAFDTRPLEFVSVAFSVIMNYVDKSHETCQEHACILCHYFHEN